MTKSKRTPYWVLLVCLGLTVGAGAVFDRAVRASDAARFQNAVQSTADRIRHRIDTYTALLLATRSHVSTRLPIEERPFRDFLKGTDVSRRYPGIQGIGFSLRMAPAERETAERRVREQGHPQFRVWPEGERDEYHAILFLEPRDRRNDAAVGYDMYSEPVRRAAMAKARDTGRAAASRKVTLVQEIDARKQAGFLIYLPIYSHAGLSGVDGVPPTVDERRSTLYGFVYSPFRMDDLFAGIFGTERVPRVDFAIYDGTGRTPAALMTSVVSAPPEHNARFETTIALPVAGTTWTIQFRSTPAFDRVSGRRFFPAFLLVALAASVALFLASRSQMRALTVAETAERRALLARSEAEAQRNNLAMLAADLRKAVRVRDDFLSIAGHELRTPLSALKLQVQALENQIDKGVFGPLNPKLHERLVKASRHVGRLERLIDELLDVSRISSGRMVLQPEEVDLAAMVDEVLDRFSEEIARSGGAISVQTNGGVNGRWDRARLDQVLTNLIGNAVKYGAGGAIEVTAAAVGDTVLLSVRDHGIGIAPGDRDRIFGRFERAVSESHYGGLGLGLWIAQQIVSAHGGQITLDSTPGQGSTFTVQLPRHVTTAVA